MSRVKKFLAIVSFFCILIVCVLAMMDIEQKVTMADQKQLTNKIILPSDNVLLGAHKTSQEVVDPTSSGGKYSDSIAQSIIVPSVDDVREHGYPKNENGETYGPDVKESDSGPDLILVRYGDGYGYIRQSEMDNDGVESPKEAVDKMNTKEARKINVYLQDGITCIGTFVLKGE